MFYHIEFLQSCNILQCKQLARSACNGPCIFDSYKFDNGMVIGSMFCLFATNN